MEMLNDIESSNEPFEGLLVNRKITGFNYKVAYNHEQFGLSQKEVVNLTDGQYKNKRLSNQMINILKNEITFNVDGFKLDQLNCKFHVLDYYFHKSWKDAYLEITINVPHWNLDNLKSNLSNTIRTMRTNLHMPA